MKLNIDFSGLVKVRQTMGAELANVSLKPLSGLQDGGRKIIERGEDVDDYLKRGPGGILVSADGRQVTLHIYEPHEDKDSLLSDPAKKTRFHFGDCKTLEQKRANKTFNRYVISAKQDGYFDVRPKNGETATWGEELSVTLLPCHHCLHYFNYQDYRNEGWSVREKIKVNFTVETFFAENESMFRELPVHKSNDADGSPYTENWPELSRRFRAGKNWCCECCEGDFSGRRDMLHAHHIDGNKKNNRNANLRSLCILCHQKQPYHHNVSARADERLAVQKIRLSQNLTRKCSYCGS